MDDTYHRLERLFAYVDEHPELRPEFVKALGAFTAEVLEVLGSQTDMGVMVKRLQEARCLLEGNLCNVIQPLIPDLAQPATGETT